MLGTATRQEKSLVFASSGPEKTPRLEGSDIGFHYLLVRSVETEHAGRDRLDDTSQQYCQACTDVSIRWCTDETPNNQRNQECDSSVPPSSTLIRHGNEEVRVHEKIDVCSGRLCRWDLRHAELPAQCNLHSTCESEQSDRDQNRGRVVAVSSFEVATSADDEIEDSGGEEQACLYEIAQE